MNRFTTETKIDDKAVRIKVRIEDVPTLRGSYEYRVRQFQLLEELGSDPRLSACGPSDFEKLSMQHDGIRWVVETEAVAKLP